MRAQYHGMSHLFMRSLLSSTDSCQNPGNSWNSRGIDSGTGACRIYCTIPAECRMEWFQDSHGQNGTQNDRNGILNAQIEHQQMPMLSLGIINPSICSSSTTTTIDNTHPPLPPHHCHLIATITSLSPSPLATMIHIHRPQPPQGVAMPYHTVAKMTTMDDNDNAQKPTNMITPVGLLLLPPMLAPTHIHCPQPIQQE